MKIKEGTCPKCGKNGEDFITYQPHEKYPSHELEDNLHFPFVCDSCGFEGYEIYTTTFAAIQEITGFGELGNLFLPEKKNYWYTDMKIISKQNKSYPDDTSIQIQAVFNDGSIMGLFNLYPKRDRFTRWYENDTYSKIFNTIKDAKEFAKIIPEVVKRERELQYEKYNR